MGFLERLREALANAEFILYIWDSVKRLPGLGERRRFFDSAFTFDRLDAELDKSMIFRPLFYRYLTSENVRNNVEKKFDVSFIGLLHSDRLRVARNLNMAAKKNAYTTFIYLYTGFLTWLKFWFKGES